MCALFTCDTDRLSKDGIAWTVGSDWTFAISCNPGSNFSKLPVCFKKLIASIHNSSNSIIITRKSDVIKAEKDEFAKTLMFAEDRANSLYQMLLRLNKIKQAKLSSISDVFDKTTFI